MSDYKVVARPAGRTEHAWVTILTKAAELSETEALKIVGRNRGSASAQITVWNKSHSIKLSSRGQDDGSILIFPRNGKERI